MKLNLVILITLLIIMPCLAKRKKRKPCMNVKDNSYRYISNWNQYDIPKPIPVDVSRKILTKISMYKRDEFYPFGIDMCDPNQVDSAQVTAKIVKDAVTDDKHLNSDENDMIYEGNVIKTLNNKKTSSGQINEQEVPILEELIHNVMSNNMNKNLELTGQMNKEFHGVHPIQRLNGARYKYIKTHNNKRTFIKKFEQKMW